MEMLQNVLKTASCYPPQSRILPKENSLTITYLILDEKCSTPRQRRAIQLIAADTADSPADLADGTADEAADGSADEAADGSADGGG